MTQQMAISASERTAATTEFTNSFAIITRTRFGSRGVRRSDRAVARTPT